MWREIRSGEVTALVALQGRVWMALGLGPRYGDAGDDGPPVELLGSLPGGAQAVRWCRQVHGRILASLSREPGNPLQGAACVGRCDGLLTDEPGIVVAVRTADCVPVLIHGGGVVAAVHAGWRGAAAGIVPRAVRRFEVEYGVPAGELTAVLGPHVGSCHYEVGSEVVEALGRVAGDPGEWLHEGRVDLGAIIVHQLVMAGVGPFGAERVGGCTACDPRLASYRRDGDAAGRQWSAVALLDA